MKRSAKLETAITRNNGTTSDLEWLCTGDNFQSVMLLAKGRARLVTKTPDEEKARVIMGKNFFGIDEAIKYFGVKPSEQQLAFMSNIPFSEEVLTFCKDTHVLIAVFPLSIMEIQDKHSKLFRDGGECEYSQYTEKHRAERRKWHDAWIRGTKSCREKGTANWQLVRKTAVKQDHTPYKQHRDKWERRFEYLAANEEMPKSRVVVYTVIGHFLATGERLFEEEAVLCDEPEMQHWPHSAAYVPIVGYFREKFGLSVESTHAESTAETIPGGLASAILA